MRSTGCLPHAADKGSLDHGAVSLAESLLLLVLLGRAPGNAAAAPAPAPSTWSRFSSAYQRAPGKTRTKAPRAAVKGAGINYPTFPSGLESAR